MINENALSEISKAHDRGFDTCILMELENAMIMITWNLEGFRMKHSNDFDFYVFRSCFILQQCKIIFMGMV